MLLLYIDYREYIKLEQLQQSYLQYKKKTNEATKFLTVSELQIKYLANFDLL